MPPRRPWEPPETAYRPSRTNVGPCRRCCCLPQSVLLAVVVDEYLLAARRLVQQEHHRERKGLLRAFALLNPSKSGHVDVRLWVRLLQQVPPANAAPPANARLRLDGSLPSLPGGVRTSRNEV